MFNTLQERVQDNDSLLGSLRTIFDEMTEFKDCCSFLCDAFASISAQEDAIEADTVRGISLFSNWMKTRIAEIKADLKKIYNRGRNRGRS